MDKKTILEKWIVLSGMGPVADHLLFFIDCGYVGSPSDLYKLSQRHLFTNPEVDAALAAEILEVISKSKDVGIARAVLSLAPDLEVNFVQQLCSEKNSSVDVINECSESKYYDHLIVEIDKLNQLGISLSLKDDTIFQEIVGGPLNGKNIAVVGSLSADYLVVKDVLESFGAKVSNKINNNTEYLLVGEKAGGAVDEAITKGITILTESDMEKLLS